MKRLFSLLLAITLLTACSSSEPDKRTILAMDTVISITAYGRAAQGGIESAESVIRELDSLLSVTDEESEIFAINRGGRAADLSEHSISIIRKALELGEMTGGALDITIYPVVRAWGFTVGEYSVPDSELIYSLLENVDYSKIVLDDAGISLPDGAMLDLGAIAKGYTGDTAADALREAGVKSALLDLGGNIQTVGAKPDGSSWRVAVNDPFDPQGEPFGVIELDGSAAVITSGGYERFFEQDGKTYWHIIDPHTGYPADNGLVSVTVTGESGAVCDGLSTALFIMGRDAALELLDSLPGYEALLVEKDGSVTVTKGLLSSFSLTGKEGFTLVDTI